MLDHERMVSQFVGLERRIARSGRDSVDHGVGSHDDISNSVAGVIVAAQGSAPGSGWLEYMQWMAGVEPERSGEDRIVRIRAPERCSHLQTRSGRQLVVPFHDRILELAISDAQPLLGSGWELVA